MATIDFLLRLRAAHFFNLPFLSLLFLNGLDIPSTHPNLHLNDDCRPGAWLKFTKKKFLEHGLEFWTWRDEEGHFFS